MHFVKGDAVFAAEHELHLSFLWLLINFSLHHLKHFFKLIFGFLKYLLVFSDGSHIDNPILFFYVCIDFALEFFSFLQLVDLVNRNSDLYSLRQGEFTLDYCQIFLQNSQRLFFDCEISNGGALWIQLNSDGFLVESAVQD